MSIALLEMPSKAEVEISEFVPDPHHWTVEEFCEMMGLPRFQDRRFILIDGQVIEMPRPNAPHDSHVAIAQANLQSLFGAGYWARSQSGLPLGFDTDPIPDIAVVTGTILDYMVDQPTTAVLIVEVSDSTLRADLKVKSHLYAAAGIPEYWVVDVANKQLHVHREPVADADAPRGVRYTSIQVLTPADSFAPLAFPDKTIRVADLLP
jgi:Uma2 family endonuclease